MRKGHVHRVVALVIILNFIQLGYFLLHRSIDQHSEQQQQRQQQQQRRQSKVHSYIVKKWSQVESYSPWQGLDRQVPSHSCEAFFGNGFTEFRRVVKNPVNRGGSFHCYRSDTLKTSICEGTKMVMHPSRISMTAGGEEIDAVIGRGEQDELPAYKEGAFQLQVPDEADGKALLDASQLDEVIARGHINRHAMRALVESIRTISTKKSECSEVITRPTLFVTRFEYANLFHTVTDWYSSYASSRVAGLEERPMVVFLDGHCKSPMDDGWEAFFSGVKYAKHFGDNICFDRAVFVPLGYDTALFKSLGTGLPCTGSTPSQLDPSKTARLREFGEIFSAAFSNSSNTGDNEEQKIQDSRDVQILLIRREDYLAHPRHSGRPEARLTNEEELYKAMVDWAKANSRFNRNISVYNGLFAHMNLADQIRAVQTSSIIVGVHGAGLTHIIFARPGTSVVEMLSPLFMRPHYQFISQWMGLEYRSIVMDEATVECSQVLHQLDLIVANRDGAVRAER